MSIHATSTEVYSGKNLYNPTISPTTAYGVTGVGTVNGFTLNGTANANGYRLGFNSATLPAGTYTVTVYYDSGTHSGGNIPFILYKTGTWTSVTTFYAMNFSPDSTPGSRTTTFTLSEETEVTLYVYFGNDPTFPTFTDFKCRVQVESGSEETPYEPYVGGVPSPLISGVAHVSTSKNLLNLESDSNGEYFGTTSQQTYSGKNLLNIAGKTGYGVAGTVNADGSVTISGKATTTDGVPVFSYNGTLPAGTYTLSLSKALPRVINMSLAQGVSARITAGNTAATVTSTQAYSGFSIYYGVVNGTTYDETFKMQLVSGSTPDYNFEPYVGGVPSPNPDYPQEIVTGKLASKNLCPDTTEGYYVTSTSTGWGKTNVDSGVLIAVEPNTNYTISTTATQSRYRFCFVASLDNYTGYNGGANDGGSNTYTKNSGSYPYLIVNATDLSKIQVEKGSTATTFEPYFTPIELAKIGDYQDRVYKSGNDWYTRKEIAKVVLNGTGDYGTLGNGSGGEKRFRLIDSAVGNIPTNVRGTYCDKYKGVSQTMSVPTPNSISQWSQQNMLLVTTDKTAYSLDDFKADLANSPVTAYCVGATPTDTAITDSPTIAWLNKYDTDSLPHHKYVNTRRTTYVGASGLASAIDLYDGSYASALPTYTTANDHNLTTANGGTYTVSLQNISASIVSGTVTFSVFTNQRKIDFSWNDSATSTSVSISLQANEYIKSIYAYIPQDADAGITLSQQLESGSLTDFEPYYNIVRIYAGDDLVFEDTSLTD